MDVSGPLGVPTHAHHRHEHEWDFAFSYEWQQAPRVPQQQLTAQREVSHRQWSGGVPVLAFTVGLDFEMPIHGTKTSLFGIGQKGHFFEVQRDQARVYGILPAAETVRYRVTVGSPGVRCVFEAERSAHELGDSMLNLYASDGTTLVQSNDDWSGNNGWTVPNPLHDTVTPFDNILGSLIIITAWAPEYVLAVSGYETSEGAFLVTGQCDSAALSIVPETDEGAGDCDVGLIVADGAVLEGLQGLLDLAETLIDHVG